MGFEAILDTILHEMCHAILYQSCICSACECELNSLGHGGISGHGPDFQKFVRAAEEVVRGHLPWYGKTLTVDGASFQEEEAKTGFLKGQSENVKQEERASEHAEKDQ